MSEQDEIKKARADYEDTLLAKDNVVGVGVGYKTVGRTKSDDLCLIVMVQQKITQAGLRPGALVPGEVSGVPTDIVQVGEIRAQQARTDRFRPAPGGVSIGHYQVSAGTLGIVVRDRSSGDRLILSNNHVLANSNDARVGDPVLQPGGADGGTVEQDMIAQLERFCQIDFGEESGDCNVAASYAGLGNVLAALAGSGHRLNVLQRNQQASNTVDAALARPINDGDILNEILAIGTVTGTVQGLLGTPVRKSGRTTELTTGEITVIDATVSVNYGSGRTATFENQFVSGPMSQGGDSGSLIVAADSLEAVGLLFAGSSQSTIFNPIQLVLDCLDIEI